MKRAYAKTRQILQITLGLYVEMASSALSLLTHPRQTA